jgi:hypothetical protein
MGASVESTPYGVKGSTQETLILLNLLIPALVGALGIVVAALVTSKLAIRTYRAQKRIDRADSLLDQRQKANHRYLTAYRAYTSLYDFGPPPAENEKKRTEAVSEYWLAYSDLFQLATEPVLLAVTDFHNFAWMEVTDLTGEAYDQEFKRQYAAMIIEMRRDAYPDTAVFDEAEVLRKLPLPFYSRPS